MKGVNKQSGLAMMCAMKSHFVSAAWSMPYGDMALTSEESPRRAL